MKTDVSKRFNQLIYDGKCPFCICSVQRLKCMDLSGTLQLIDLHSLKNIKTLHPDLTRALAMSQIHLIEPDGALYGGFRVFQRLCFKMPMLYLLIPVFYFPGMRVIGSFVYRIIAKKRYLLHRDILCKNNSCLQNDQDHSSR